MTDRYPTLFSPKSVGGLALKNRLVVAPLTRVSAGPAGVPTDRMVEYYAAYARGGFGLIITEGTYTDDRYSQGYSGQPGLVASDQRDGWGRVVRAIHDTGGRVFLQLMHAGALSQHLAETISASAVTPKGQMMPAYGGAGPFRTPREVTADDIRYTVEGFARTARLAREVGFDGVEIHGANGYIIDQFLTAYTNRRSDDYGGGVQNRARFVSEVVAAVRAAVGADFPVGIRLSQTKVNDLEYRYPGGRADAEVIFAAVKGAGADFIHVANRGPDVEPAAMDATGVTPGEVARAVTGLPVITNGGLDDPDLAENALRAGRGDLVALGRGAIANPDWPNRVAAGRSLTPFDPDMIRPAATIANTDAYFKSRLRPNDEIQYR